MDELADSHISEALLDAISGAVYVLTGEGAVDERLRAADATGFPVGDPRVVDGADIRALLDAEPADRLVDAIDATLSTGETRRLTYSLSGDWADGGGTDGGDGPDSAGRAFDVELRPLDPDGTPGRVLAIVRARTESGPIPQGAFAAAVEQAPVGVVLTDPERPDNPMVFVNDQFTAQTGYTEAAALGRNCRFLQGEDTSDGPVRRLREAIDAREATTVELLNYRADGTEFWNRVSVAPVTTADGREWFVGFQQDVTESRKHERALAAERRLAEQSLDALEEVFYVLDTDGTVRRWNDTFPEVSGYDDDEIAGRSALSFFEDEDRERVADAIAAVLERGTAAVEASLVTADGETIPYEFTGTTLTDEDGDLEGILGIGRDVTDRREHERELEKSNERLEQFAYIASHDLQEPLRTISNYIELVATQYGDELDDDAREYIDTVVTSSERMQSMINGLLDYSRVTTRGGEFEPVDTEAALEDVVADLEWLLADHDGTVEWKSLPTVEADPDQFRQLLQNLVKNALEHSDDEPVTVSISATETADGYRFAVADDGPGIDPAAGDDIFELFNSNQRDQTSSDVRGIGLAISETIVRRHGGDIRVESDPGEGATFYFTIDG
jgi:PAS domain S-box-containing protein